jgi:hypothetical protein
MSVAYKIENKPLSKKPIAHTTMLRELKVGQSFYIPPGKFNLVLSLRATGTRETKQFGTQYSVVAEGKGYRCGRIK